VDLCRNDPYHVLSGHERNTSFLEDYDIKENDDALVFNQIENHNKIDIGKRVSLMSIHTPGHTNGGMCFRLVIDDIDNERKYNNNISSRRATAYLFTGDTMFVNGIGRPDLQDKAKESTYNLYNTYQQNILLLSNETIILPAHFSDGFEHERPIYDTLESITTKVKVISASKGMAQVSWKLGIL
jgi:glyoxylase-like metal-dependent hydrolase (beta-lactamase superfamily II)